MEGEDKPLRYPTIYNSADLAVITKVDQAEAVGFRRADARRNIREVRPGLEILETSARTGEGMPGWLRRLEELSGLHRYQLVVQAEGQGAISPRRPQVLENQRHTASRDSYS